MVVSSSITTTFFRFHEITTNTKGNALTVLPYIPLFLIPIAELIKQ